MYISVTFAFTYRFFTLYVFIFIFIIRFYITYIHIYVGGWAELQSQVYRNDCPQSNKNLVATHWIMIERNMDAPKVFRKKILVYRFCIYWFCVWIRLFLWCPLQSREIFCATFWEANQNVVLAKGRREECFVCNRGLQSSSCDKLSCDNQGQGKQKIW